MTTNTNVTATILAELGVATNSGLRLGFVEGGTYGTQNDTLTIQNATEVVFADFTTDADGVANVVSDITTNVITLSSATATDVSGIVIFR